MRAYVRNVENRDEIIQVLNSQIEKVILPEIGDTILEKYVVIDREWLSLEGDKDKINLEERIKKLSPDTEINIL